MVFSLPSQAVSNACVISLRLAHLRATLSSIEWHQAQAILHEAGNHNVQVHTVSRAGHHLYLDNPAEFGALVQEVLAS